MKIREGTTIIYLFIVILYESESEMLATLIFVTIRSMYSFGKNS